MVEGPLDTVRRVGIEAEELDEFAMSQPRLTESELYGEFARTVFERDGGHPLMGERVIVYGVPLTIGTELDETSEDLDVYPLAIASPEAPSTENRPSVGVYEGLTVTRPFDFSRGEYVHRVAHIVYTGSSQMFPDEYGNMQQTHYREYILAKGSEVVPYDPVNAHSFRDMRDDPVVRMIDRIAFSESQSGWRLTEETGLAVAAILNEREHEDEQNQQRLSYLNSLGLLDNVELITGEFALGDKYHYEASPSLMFNEDPSACFVITPNLFHFLNGYERLGPNGSVALGREPELFVEGTLEDGQTVILPFQDIKGGYDVEWYD